MSEVQEANPADGVQDIPVNEQAPVTQDAGAEAEDGLDEDDIDELDRLAGLEPGEGTPEEQEVEYEGKTYKLPPELKDALLRQADYTKKTMTLAEERKAVEAAKAHLEEISSYSEESRASLMEAAVLRMQLQSLENTPIDGLTQEQVNALRLDHAALREQVALAEGKGKAAAEKEQAARSQQFAKAREQVVSETAKIIPNFSTQRQGELEAFLVSNGANPDFAKQIVDPLVYKIAHLADIGQKYIERQRKAKTVADAQQVEPAMQVGGKARSGKSLSTMSPEEYHKARVKQRGPI